MLGMSLMRMSMMLVRKGSELQQRNMPTTANSITVVLFSFASSRRRVDDPDALFDLPEACNTCTSNTKTRHTHVVEKERKEPSNIQWLYDEQTQKRSHRRPLHFAPFFTLNLLPYLLQTCMKFSFAILHASALLFHIIHQYLNDRQKQPSSLTHRRVFREAVSPLSQMLLKTSLDA